ncbi:MAG: hypothetical protein AAGG81_00105, partial [Chlamydiota bacterium]
KINCQLEKIQHLFSSKLPEGEILTTGSVTYENVTVGRGSVLHLCNESIKNVSIGINSTVYIHRGVKASGLKVGDNVFAYIRGVEKVSHNMMNDHRDIIPPLIPRYSVNVVNTKLGNYVCYRFILNDSFEGIIGGKEIDCKIKAKNYYSHNMELIKEFGQN